MVHTRFTWLLGALLLGALAPAQQQTEQPPPAQESAAKGEFKELTEAYTTASREAAAKRRAEAAAAKQEGKPTPALSMVGPAAEWLPKFQAGADKYKGTDGAVPFLVWIGNNSRGPDKDAVLATLMTDHIKSPEFGGVLRLITSQMSFGSAINMRTGQPVGDEDAEAMARKKAAAEQKVRGMLARVIAENPSPDVAAQALLARANLVLQVRGEVDAAAKAAAMDDVRAGAKLAVEAKLKGQLDGILYEQQHLQVGMIAPEIAGQDLDGVDFKLSDYRGKVVLLDFWGYW